MGWPLIVLYALGVVLAGLMGCRHAMARDARIDKGRYLRRSIVFAVGIGQLNIALAALGLALGWLINPNPAELLATLHDAGLAALMVYGTYTLIVALTFVGYAVPNTEVRSLVTVAIFGPLTLIQPVVVLLGLVAALAVQPSLVVVVGFVPCVAFMLGFERVLESLEVWRWAHRGEPELALGP
ncbi:MAG: hypothetical protein AAFX99_24915 [Myxococcota bacterium]